MLKNKILNNKKYYIIVFNSKNVAIQIYYNLETKGNTKFQLISTPCKIKAGCSYSIKFNDLRDINMLLNESKHINKNSNDIYLVERKDGKKEYTKIENIIN